jgi:outer membrane protein assembly factor BamB
MESIQKQFDHANGNYILDVHAPEKRLKELWKRDFDAQSAPFVYEGILYLSEDHTFYAIDPVTGNTIWEFKTPGRTTSPVFHNELVIFGGYYIDSHVYALDKNSGKEIWKYRTGASTAPVKRTPIVQDDLLYLTAGKSIHCISVVKGKKQWTFGLKKKSGNTNMVLASGKVYAVTQEAAGKEELQCIDSHKKELVWKIKTPNLWSNLICAEEYLFYLNTNAELCEVNLVTGEIVKSKITDFTSRMTNGSLNYNNGILIMTAANYIFGLNLNTNPWSWKWNFKTKADIGRAVIAKDKIYFATMGDGIYALDANSGQELFHKESDVRSGLACGIYDSKIYVAGSMNEKELTAYAES